MLSALLRHDQPPNLAGLFLGPTATRPRRPQLAVHALEGAAPGRTYGGVDWSDWQEWPTWGSIGGDFLCCRLGDGTYVDEMWVQSWSWIQSQPARYKGWYILPDPRLGWQRQADQVRAVYQRAGVSFGSPGHFWCVDDEPTTIHGAFSGGEMVSLIHSLEDTFQRPPLFYTGLYSGNYDQFIWADDGYVLWAPWPVGNGAFPSWTRRLGAWQYGVAGAGEIPGFPSTGVDVDMIWDQTLLDPIAGYSGTKGWLDMLTDDEQAALRDQVSWIFHIMADEARFANLFNKVVATEAAAATTNVAAIRTNQVIERFNLDAYVKDTSRASGRNLYMDAADDRAASAAARPMVGTIAGHTAQIPGIADHVSKIPTTGVGPDQIDQIAVAVMARIAKAFTGFGST